MRIEHKIYFTDILKEIIKDLNKDLDQVKNSKFTLLLVDNKDECQSGVSSKDYFAFMRQCFTFSHEVRVAIYV